MCHSSWEHMDGRLWEVHLWGCRAVGLWEQLAGRRHGGAAWKRHRPFELRPRLKPAPLPLCLPCCSKVDQLAAKVGADPHLASRAAMAMQQALGAAAAEEGHTYLPWHRLEKDCGRLLRDAGMQHGNPWQHQAALHLVAQHMHSCGAIVAEPPLPAGGAHAAAGAAGQPAAAAAAGDEVAAAAPEAAARAAPARTHPTFDGIDELRQYLNARLKGVLGSTPCIEACLQVANGWWGLQFCSTSWANLQGSGTIWSTAANGP